MLEDKPLVEDTRALESRILTAMSGLGREPDLSRIAKKAQLPVITEGRMSRLAPEAIAAMNALLQARRIVNGTRGGFRLVGR
jgi:hypothetical protein